jgi:hypothetical protein
MNGWFVFALLTVAIGGPLIGWALNRHKRIPPPQWTDLPAPRYAMPAEFRPMLEIPPVDRERERIRYGLRLEDGEIVDFWTWLDG